MTYNPNFFGKTETSIGQSVSGKETNLTGITISKLTPVRIMPDGSISVIDISVEDHVLALAGITSENIADGNVGSIVNSGRITNVTTSYPYGTCVWISKAGDLTDQKPEVGTNGYQAFDYAVKVGVIAKNQDNPALKDLVINLHINGRML